MEMFDHTAPAELFHALRAGRGAPLGFHRFETSAEGIKYAVEELSSVILYGAILEVAEQRFSGHHIRELYNDKAFPLHRRDG
jgi:hypothetical protein